MLVKFGYVAIALNLKDSSTSKTITLSNLQKLPDAESQKARLTRIAKGNLENTLRVIRYNRFEKIHLYRFTSKLIPFATYPLEFAWHYEREFAEDFAKIGKAVMETGLRVSAHPDHFTVINSQDENVFEQSVKDLEYHNRVFEAMGLDNRARLITHVGGFYGNKEKSIERFMRNFERLPDPIKQRLTLENDDKIYNAQEVLELCSRLKVPMVLDLHHHSCNPGGDLAELLEQIWSTWQVEPPKIHISSPRDDKHFRHHADYVEADTLAYFLATAKALNKDFDVMVEAKMKDQAMFKLVEDLAEHHSIKKIDPTTLEI